jgi:chaperonin cofactor prefoldin
MSIPVAALLAGLPLPPARIVHVGAGNGADLADWAATGAARIVLVEAIGELAAQARAAARGMDHVAVVEAVVSGDASPRPFHATALPELNSLRAPLPALIELFPGLRPEPQPARAPVLPQDLPLGDPAPLSEGADAPEACSLLVLETPGEALSILSALDGADLLTGFDVIALREPAEPLYEGAPGLAHIRNWCARSGFLWQPLPEGDDPDRPWSMARLNRPALDLQARLDAVTTLLEDSRAEVAQAAEASAARDQKIADLTGARDRLKAQVAQLETHKAEADALRAQVETLTGERNTLKNQTGGQSARVQELQQRLDKATAQAETDSAEAAKLRARIKDLNGESASAKEQIATQAARIKDLQGQLQAAKQDTAPTAALADARARLEAGRTELLRAEAQIQLLRDLLLGGGRS